MPYVMTLEGPQLDRVNEIRGQLYGQPRSWWRTQTSLAGIFDPVTTRPYWVIVGLVLGAWLAGSQRGQALIKRYAPGRR